MNKCNFWQNPKWTIISQEFKNDVWDLRNLIDIFNQELVAGERYCGIEKDADNNVPKDPFFTGQSFLTHSQEKKSFKRNSWPGKCVYCDNKKHISSRCNVVTNVEKKVIRAWNVKIDTLRRVFVQQKMMKTKGRLTRNDLYDTNCMTLCIRL